MADRQRLETYQYMNTISGLKRLNYEMNLTTSIERTLDLISLRSKVPCKFFLLIRNLIHFFFFKNRHSTNHHRSHQSGMLVFVSICNLITSNSMWIYIMSH
ncbi:hypothetical protein Hanom_Chr12g01117801 [Helianthus anomalus]